MSAAGTGPRPAATPRPFKIALMAALSLEVRPFLRHIGARRYRGLGLPAWEFALGEGRGVVALSGMGYSLAQAATAQLLARCRPAILMSVGFGGALTPEVPAGALVLGESFWQYHPKSGVLEEVPAPLSPRPLPELLRRLKGNGLAAFTGSLVTTPYIISKKRQGEALRHLATPVLDLETSALAQAATAHGLPFVSLRAITDVAFEEIPDFIQEALEPGRKFGLGTVFTWLAADPRRAKTLLHLRRRSRLAALLLARALNLLLSVI